MVPNDPRAESGPIPAMPGPISGVALGGSGGGRAGPAAAGPAKVCGAMNYVIRRARTRDVRAIAGLVGENVASEFSSNTQ